MKQDILKQFKIVKTVQLAILIIIELASFIIIMVNEQLRNSIYSNPSLFTLCAMMWFVLIFVFICIIYDFAKLQVFTKDNHMLNKVAYLDNMTGIPNRYSCDLIFKNYHDGQNMDNIGCGIMEISNLNAINDRLGHESGDKAIQIFSNLLDEVGDTYGFVGRNSGNEFLVIIDDCIATRMEDFFQTLTSRLNQYNKENPDLTISFSHAYILNRDLNAKRFSDIITLAYKKLHNMA